MPLLYGEGHKAFHRLQELIIRESGDDSILAWDYFKAESRDDDINYENVLLAPSPDFFRGCRNVRHCRPTAWNDVVDLTNHGLRFKSHYISGHILSGLHYQGPQPSKGGIVLLNCYREDDPGLRYALRLQLHGDDGSGQKGFSVCPQSRNAKNTLDMFWAMSLGLCTRLVLVGRKGGQLAGTRETNLITKTLSEDRARFRIAIRLKSAHRLKFEHVLRPSDSHTEHDDHIIAPLPADTIDSSLLIEEAHRGDSWSISLPSHNRQKLVLVGACIRDHLTNKKFLLFCGHSDANVLPQRADDGDYGVELRSIIDNTYGPFPATRKQTGALTASAEAIRQTCMTLRSKQYTLSLPDVGVITATCHIGDFEGLTMNVEVTLIAEEQRPQRKEKGMSAGQRFYSWVSRADLRTAMQHADQA